MIDPLQRRRADHLGPCSRLGHRGRCLGPVASLDHSPSKALVPTFPATNEANAHAERAEEKLLEHGRAYPHARCATWRPARSGGAPIYPTSSVARPCSCTTRLAVAAFLAVSFAVARWLTQDSRERGAVTDLLRAQGRGDAAAMLALLDGLRPPRRLAPREGNARPARARSCQDRRDDSCTAHSLATASARRASPGRAGPKARHRAVRGRSSAVASRRSAPTSVSRRSGADQRGVRMPALMLAPAAPRCSLSLAAARRRRAGTPVAACRRPRHRPPRRPPLPDPARSSPRPPAAPSTRAARPAASSSTVPGSSVPTRPATATCRACRAPPATAGWTTTTVPNAWNATDESARPPNRSGRLVPQGLPRCPMRLARLMWVIRFESVNYRARVWLNGQPDRHERRRLPAVRAAPAARPEAQRREPARRAGRLRRAPTDFPPAESRRAGKPLGGWWNYGGILREVYLRKIDDIDITTRRHVRPDVPCGCVRGDRRWARPRCATRASRRGASRSTGRFGRAAQLGTRAIGAKRVRDLHEDAADRQACASGSRTGRTSTTPGLLGHVEGPQARRRCTRRSACARSRAADGRMLPQRARDGLARRRAPGGLRARRLRDRQRRREQELRWRRGARRPLISRALPAAPRTRSSAPTSSGCSSGRRSPSTRSTPRSWPSSRCATPAVQACSSDSVIANRNHPSILPVVDRQRAQRAARAGPGLVHRARRAARAKALDPSRPVGARRSRLPDGRLPEGYAPLDVLGINDYFGWYPGTNGADRRPRRCSPAYLDSLRACYPTKALMDQRVRRRGQPRRPRRGARDVRVPAATSSATTSASTRPKPWLSGSIYWALQEFRVRPAGTAATRVAAADPPEGRRHASTARRSRVRRSPAGLPGDDQFRALAALSGARGRGGRYPDRPPMADKTTTLTVTPREPDGSRSRAACGARAGSPA